MKRLILLLFMIVSSCSNKIDKTEIQGTWYWNFKEDDRNNLGEIIIRNDSIILIDYLNLVKKGIYIIKNDSIIINLKNETLKKKVNVTDSSLILNLSNFRKSYEEDEIINLKEHDLINIDSDIKIFAEDLLEYEGEFLLFKDKDSLKIKHWNKNVSLEEYIYSLRVHSEKIGHIAFLGKNIELKELKNLFLEMNNFNIRGIILITKTNFNNYNYDIYFVRTDVWQLEVDNYIKNKKIEKNKNLNILEAYSKERYVKINNPFLLEIKTKKDISKLDITKNNSTYLISINSELDIKDYLILWQKINRVRKEKSLKIRTEIIEFPQHQ